MSSQPGAGGSCRCEAAAGPANLTWGDALAREASGRAGRATGLAAQPAAAAGTDGPRRARGWLADWLTVRGLGDVRVIRQSVGAQLAAHLAGQTLNRVRAMLLQGPVFDPTYRTVLRGLGRWLADMPREHPGLAVREVPDQVGPRRVARCCGSRCRTGSRTRWPVSTYLCWSSWASTSRCPAGGGGARWRVPGGAPVVMPGLPHSAPNAAPERFARLVRACDAQLRGCNPSQGPDDSR